MGVVGAFSINASFIMYPFGLTDPSDPTISAVSTVVCGVIATLTITKIVFDNHLMK